jgi:hypothetical protein
VTIQGNEWDNTTISLSLLFHVHIFYLPVKQLLVFHRAPPLVAGGECSPDVVGIGVLYPPK